MRLSGRNPQIGIRCIEPPEADRLVRGTLDVPGLLGSHLGQCLLPGRTALVAMTLRSSRTLPLSARCRVGPDASQELATT